jgi:hypothetical protein
MTFPTLLTATILFALSSSLPAAAVSGPKPNEAKIAVLVNQVGYDSTGCKILVVQVRDPQTARPAEFQLATGSGHVMFRGGLIARRRIHAGTSNDWGAAYWTGDFTRFTKPGKYHATVQVGDEKVVSFPFEIGKQELFRITAENAARFFYWQRCGFAIPGIHPACHLDDGRLADDLGGGHLDAVGGWHDAGDYNKYNGYTPHSVYALAVLARDPARLLTARARQLILEESKWGADWLLKMWRRGHGLLYGNVFCGYRYWGTPDKETDNVKGTSDDRPIRGQGPNAMAAAAFAVLAVSSGEPKYREAAEDLWRGAANAKQFDATLLLADLEMENLTGKPRYHDNASQCVEALLKARNADGLWLPHVVEFGVPPAALGLFAKAYPDDPATRKITVALKRWLERSLLQSDNAYQITPWSEGVFFQPYENTNSTYGGQNSQYLSQAWALYLTSDLLKDPRARALADRQMDWVLGVNPFSVCMMEGAGSFHFPTYHHCYTGRASHQQPGIPGQERGAIPGAVANGLCRPQGDLDKPWGDFAGNDYHSNEPWLPHNAFYILAVNARAGQSRRAAHRR